MNDKNTRKEDEANREPSTPDPTWNPTDARLIRGLYGPAAADQWFAATKERRRGMIRHLMRHGSAHVRPPETSPIIPVYEPEPDEMPEIHIDIDEFESEMKKLDELRAAAFMPELRAIDALRKAHEKYERQIAEKVAEGPGAGEEAARRAAAAVARRRLQSHMVQCLLDGELTYADCMERVKADPLCAALTKHDAMFEYDSYLELLIEREQATMLLPPR